MGLWAQLDSEQSETLGTVELYAQWDSVHNGTLGTNVLRVLAAITCAGKSSLVSSDKRTAEHLDRRIPVVDTATGAGYHGDGRSGQADQGSTADGEHLHSNQPGQIL